MSEPAPRYALLISKGRNTKLTLMSWAPTIERAQLWISQSTLRGWWRVRDLETGQVYGPWRRG